MKPRRVFVRGTTGAGKTTLARRLAAIIGAEYVEMDAIHHMPNWTERPREETRTLVDEIVQRESWVIDGNYGHALNHHVEKAELVVWLDYPFWLVFWRLLSRTVRRSMRSEELWAGNRETFAKAFFSRDSILWWMVTTHGRRHRQCLEMERALADSPVVFLRFRRPGDTEKWVRALSDED